MFVCGRDGYHGIIKTWNYNGSPVWTIQGTLNWNREVLTEAFNQYQYSEGGPPYKIEIQSFHRGVLVSTWTFLNPDRKQPIYT